MHANERKLREIYDKIQDCNIHCKLYIIYLIEDDILNIHKNREWTFLTETLFIELFLSENIRKNWVTANALLIIH